MEANFPYRKPVELSDIQKVCYWEFKMEPTRKEAEEWPVANQEDKRRKAKRKEIILLLKHAFADVKLPSNGELLAFPPVKEMSMFFDHIAYEKKIDVSEDVEISCWISFPEKPMLLSDPAGSDARLVYKPKTN